MNILVDGISKTNGDVLYNGEKIEKLGKEVQKYYRVCATATGNI